MDYNDQTIMPFGVHQGKTLEQVPATYLLFLMDKGLKEGPLKRYIMDNMDVLKKQEGEERQEKRLQKKLNQK
jgi:uncharacterized protein (DUF3820 family)